MLVLVFVDQMQALIPRDASRSSAPIDRNFHTALKFGALAIEAQEREGALPSDSYYT